MSAISTSEVSTWLGVNIAGEDAEAMDTAVQAVNATVTNWHGDADQWSDRIHHGAVMLAAHLWRRRGTPAGVANFTEDGIAYVQKHDPQVAMLLGLGGWTIPRVG
ncbi:hypothetical protein [Corynebacterium striatum]|uniref:hypothetical protein n=1 Tax=Corynebacterium striatum TaxID=43770 RepID=UPI0027B920BE|nr:hypothetical protein [Corynebacterium striatum]